MSNDPIRDELEALIAAYDEHGGKWPDHHEQALFDAVQHARAALAASPATDEPAVPEGREPAAVNNDSIELRVQGMSAWQHIDTAPMDGTEILASDYDAIDIVSWTHEKDAPGWFNREGGPMWPAWWQLLPDHPPISQPPQGGEVEQ